MSGKCWLRYSVLLGASKVTDSGAKFVEKEIASHKTVSRSYFSRVNFLQTLSELQPMAALHILNSSRTVIVVAMGRLRANLNPSWPQ